jgi:hypothetical protein
MKSEILQPVAVLAAWSMIMWLWLYATRLPAMIKSGIDIKNMVGTTGVDIRGKVPPTVQWKADNYNHLMEQPTIFYAIALVLAFAGAGNGMNAILAWIYVAFRIAHSFVQVTVNRVPVRFALHFIGTIPLLMLAAHAVFASGLIG